MNATDPSSASIFQTQGDLEHYHVPKYQRESVLVRVFEDDLN